MVLLNSELIKDPKLASALTSEFPLLESYLIVNLSNSELNSLTLFKLLIIHLVNHQLRVIKDLDL